MSAAPTTRGPLPGLREDRRGFGVKGRRVIKKSELREAIQEMLDHDGPFVLDVIVPYTEHVLPMIPAGKTVKDMILK
jgi:acetolactate synthase-1/2/3 large subunit